MPNYILLERIELNASAASVTFANIPQSGYTDLLIKVSSRQTNASIGLKMTFNGYSAFSGRVLEGSGSSASSYSMTSQLLAGYNNSSAYTANTFGSTEIYIPNYTSTTNKSVSADSVTETNATTAYMALFADLYTTTSPVTTITFTADNSGNIDSGSTFSLYGLAALGTTPAIAPKASGGNIIDYDGTYWIHTFNTTGAFVPQTTLSCDVLVIAGGGSGGGNSTGNKMAAGGGGAGGYLYYTGQSISATSNTVTVGGGGAGSTTGSNGSNSSFGALTAAVGGGQGGSFSVPTGSSLNGGSGGGGGGRGTTETNTGGSATSGQGNAGGTGYSSSSVYNGAGGGGSAALGSAALSNFGGNGGTSTSNSITGTSTAYAGGGGGGAYESSTAAGSGGGGGAGAGYKATSSGDTGNGSAATINTGSGGGGGAAGSGGGTFSGGSGGSGIVIIRYLAA